MTNNLTTEALLAKVKTIRFQIPRGTLPVEIECGELRELLEFIEHQAQVIEQQAEAIQKAFEGDLTYLDESVCIKNISPFPND